MEFVSSFYSLLMSASVITSFDYFCWFVAGGLVARLFPILLIKIKVYAKYFLLKQELAKTHVQPDVKASHVIIQAHKRFVFILKHFKNPIASTKKVVVTVHRSFIANTKKAFVTVHRGFCQNIIVQIRSLFHKRFARKALVSSTKVQALCSHPKNLENISTINAIDTSYKAANELIQLEEPIDNIDKDNDKSTYHIDVKSKPGTRLPKNSMVCDSTRSQHCTTRFKGAERYLSQCFSPSCLQTSPTDQELTVFTAKSSSQKMDTCVLNRLINKQISSLEKMFTNVKVERCLVENSSANIVLSVTWLNQAISRLLNNAIKHSQQNVEICIRSIIDEKYLVLCVEDNGPGLSSEVRNKLNLLRVQNYKGYRRDTDEHLLLNLPVIQKHIEATGGHFDINSSANSHTSITLKIPLRFCSTPQINDFEHLKIVSKFKAPPANSNIEKVLLISDEDYHLTLRQSLQKQVFISHFSTLEAALLQLNNLKPDCIVLNMRRKLNNSLSLHEWLTQSEVLKQIPLVLIADDSETQSKVVNLRAGIAAVIGQDHSMVELRATLKTVMASYRNYQKMIDERLANYHIKHLSPALDPERIIKNDHRLQFLQNLDKVFESHYQSEGLKVGFVADCLHMTEKTFNRRLMSHCHTTFSDALRKYRLTKASKLILEGEMISNAAFECGFTSPSYFTQCFRKQYGFKPSDLVKKVSD